MPTCPFLMLSNVSRLKECRGDSCEYYRDADCTVARAAIAIGDVPVQLRRVRRVLEEIRDKMKDKT